VTGKAAARGGGCSQPGTLPQEGHQVAKLEHTNASSKLQHGLSCSNLLAAMLQLILDALLHCSKIGIFDYINHRICF
jgi:hypothetical protein